MPIGLGLLLTASLFVPPPAPADGPSQSSPADAPAASTDRPHRVGLGGFGGSSQGPSFRYFFNDRVGIDMNAGWSLPGAGGRNSAAGGTTFRAAPSGVFMLTRSRQHASLDVRPYVGGGLNYSAASTSVYQASGMGLQAFGGAEFSFASAPSIAVSAEVAYYKLAVQQVNLVTNSGTDFYVLFHYYLK